MSPQHNFRVWRVTRKVFSLSITGPDTSGKWGGGGGGNGTCSQISLSKTKMWVEKRERILNNRTTDKEVPQLWKAETATHREPC